MLHFECDYTKGAHPAVLENLCADNLSSHPGYGSDVHCSRAAELILDECGLADGRVFFLSGGTQTNATVIDALLRPWQGVVCADSGHIAVHEAGAVEASGHKVITIASDDGKVSACSLRKMLESFYSDSTWPHMVIPGMVFLSHPTELGSLYSVRELKEISGICRQYSLPLYIDGARLIYGLASDETDVDLKAMAGIADVFYIGGTKAGCLFGEAIVCRNADLLPEFFTLIKQHGALLAKGWLLGLQFEALFTDGLYRAIGRNAIDMAMKLKEGFLSKGYRLHVDSPTNQQFVILPNEVVDRLMPDVGFSIWGERGERETIVRFVTDWSTRDEDVSALIAML